jgi:hypothetical protein
MLRLPAPHSWVELSLRRTKLAAYESSISYAWFSCNVLSFIALILPLIASFTGMCFFISVLFVLLKLPLLRFAPRAFVEGRFSPQIPYIQQHWRCVFPCIALQNAGVQTLAETLAHDASTAEEQTTIGIVLQPTAQQAAYHHYSALATSKQGLPSHTAGRKSEARAPCV